MMHTRFRQPLQVALLVGCTASLGCSNRDGDAVQSVDLNAVTFEVYKTDVGVHPSTSVLGDPNNPFADVAVDDLANPTPENPVAAKWLFAQAAPAPAKFYAWATTLAGAPSGENQFYTSDALQAVYGLLMAGQLPSSGADPEPVRQMIIAGYTAQLTFFPEDYNHTAQGTADFDYSTASLKAIVALGGTPPPTWVLVTDANGQERAVKF